MFDMRYHIASLGAVFLALTVGLLLGSLLVDSGALTRRQARLMESINNDVETVLKQNRELNNQVSDLKSFQDQVWRAAVKGRLNDQSVLVASFAPNQEEIYGEISQSLAKAGANSTHLNFSLKKEDIGNQQLMSELLTPIGAVATTDTLESTFWQRLANEVSGREPLALLSALSNKGLLRIDDQNVLPVDGVIVLASEVSAETDFDSRFLEALNNTPDQAVIGAETSDFSPSRISAFQLLGVSTIDNIETVPGWISAVYLLQEKSVKANFGVKPTADRLLPQ